MASRWPWEAGKKSVAQDLDLPLSPSKRPWWRITAEVRKEERGHGEVRDREEEGYCELPLFAYSIWQLRSSTLLTK